MSGPWHTETVNKTAPHFGIIRGDEIKPIGFFYNADDARKAAAAPELYEALKIFANARVDALTGTIVLGNVGAPTAISIAKRALAKAGDTQ